MYTWKDGDPDTNTLIIDMQDAHDFLRDREFACQTGEGIFVVDVHEVIVNDPDVSDYETHLVETLINSLLQQVQAATQIFDDLTRGEYD